VSCEHSRILFLKASTAVQLYAPAVQGADHGQNAPLLQASDVPVNTIASESVFSVTDLPNEFEGAERALQAWQQHKFALWLYMVVSGLVIALSVQNHFLPTILPATLGQQLAMWGLLFLTWKPDRKLRNIDEFLQASQAAVLRQAKGMVHCKRTCFAVIILLYCRTQHSIGMPLYHQAVSGSMATQRMMLVIWRDYCQHSHSLCSSPPTKHACSLCYSGSGQQCYMLLQVQQGGSMVTALFSIALAFVFAGHKLNCFEIGQVCIYGEGIDDWRYCSCIYQPTFSVHLKSCTSRAATVRASHDSIMYYVCVLHVR